MDKFESVVLQHKRWIDKGMPVDVVPKANTINNIRKILHDIVKKAIGMPVYKFIATQDFMWEHAIIIDGLISYYDFCRSEDIRNSIINYYDGILKKKNKGCMVFSLTDQIMHGNNLLWLIENGCEQFRPLLDEAVSFIKSNINAYGFLAYSQSTRDILYVDAIGMICPFCIKYGIKYGDKDLLDLGLEQLAFHIDNVVDIEFKLPYHAFNMNSMETMGSNFWGRGLGWMFYALSGVVSDIDMFNDYYEKIIKYYGYLSHYVLSEFPDGIMYDNLKLREHTDTSVIAMVGCSIAVGILNDKLPAGYIDLLNKEILEIEKYVSSDGDVLSCSKDCSGIGNTSSEYSRFCAGGPYIKLQSLIRIINKKCKC